MKTTKKNAIQQAVESLTPYKEIIFVATGVYVVYRAITNRFVKIKEVSAYPQANVSFAQAKLRADAIYSSIDWFSNDLQNVANQLQGLNYNGFVRVYNAFGERRGTLLAGKLNLIEWLQNQFNREQIQELSFLLNGAFFRQAPTKAIEQPTQKITNSFTGV